MQLLPVGYRGRSNNQFVAPACSWFFFCPTTTETKELKSDAEKVEVTRVKAKVLLSCVNEGGLHGQLSVNV